MIRLALLLAILLPGAAFAEAQAAPDTAQKPVPAYGDDHPGCEEWTDGCVVCRRGADGADCSLPGIACLPTEPECRRPGDARPNTR